MEDNKNIENETVVENGAESATDNSGAETTETNETTETITLTQEELDKRIQSAEDKLRTKYSKQIKDLEKQIADAKPVEKSEQEKDYEKRLAALEAREKAQALNDALDSKGIDKSIAKFLNADVNVDDLATAIDTLFTNRNKANSYVPQGHKSSDEITVDEFKRMNMDEKERLFQESPELYKTLARKMRE